MSQWNESAAHRQGTFDDIAKAIEKAAKHPPDRRYALQVRVDADDFDAVDGPPAL